MLIWINDESIADLATGSNQTILALEHLATAYREGKHIVLGKRNTLETIVASGKIESKATIVYNELIAKLPELFNIRSELSTYVEVIGKESALKIDRSHGKNIIRLPVTFFSDSYNLQKTLLLCENSKDGDFYEFIGMAYMSNVNMKNISVELDNSSPLSGGNGYLIYKGRATAKSDARRLAFCILDSDKVAPVCSLGSTAKKVIEIHNKYLPVFMDYYVLESREVENILPFKFIEMVCASDTNKAKIVKSLNYLLINTELQEIYPFVDLKNGTVLYEPIKKVADSTSIELWKSKAQIIIKQNSQCIENWSCLTKNKKGQGCTCSISEGLGEIMDDIIKYIQDDRINKYKLAREVWQHLSPSQKVEWEKIGSNIISWGASLSRSYSS
jgi:hypothetical protein